MWVSDLKMAICATEVGGGVFLRQGRLVGRGLGMKSPSMKIQWKSSCSLRERKPFLWLNKGLQIGGCGASTRRFFARIAPLCALRSLWLKLLFFACLLEFGFEGGDEGGERFCGAEVVEPFVFEEVFEGWKGAGF